MMQSEPSREEVVFVRFMSDRFFTGAVRILLIPSLRRSPLTQTIADSANDTNYRR